MDQESVGGLTVALLWLCHTDRLSFEMLISGYGLSCVPFLNSDDKDGSDKQLFHHTKCIWSSADFWHGQVYKEILKTT